MKKCQFCGGDIPDQAVKCKLCENLEDKIKNKMNRTDEIIIKRLMEEQGLTREEAEEQLEDFII